jgi:hypothetical protein
MLGQQPFGTICDNASAMQVAEKPAQFPVPDLNPKMRVQKIKCRYYKT